MRVKLWLWAGFGLTLLVALAGVRSEANPGLFNRHHGDCDANASTVRLPAQNIRIETTAPRVIVQESGGHSRHFRQTYQPYMVGVPLMGVMPAQPIVASFLVPPAQEPANSSASNALRAYHDLEAQALQVARVRAIQEAEIAAMNQAHQRIMAGFTKPAQNTAATSSEITQLKTEIEKLSSRISDIERLLIIHDDLLKKRKEEGK